MSNATTSQPRTRALSLRAATECEHAALPRCTCRCGGALHGRRRLQDVRQLPLDDPHSPSRECKSCRGTRLLIWHDWEGIQRERQCPRCKGEGRYIDPRVLKADLREAITAAW